MFCKKREKTVFSHVFRDILNKVRKKCEKKTFFELLAWRPRKSVRKSVLFSRFSRHSVQSSQKMIKKNSVFWAFCTSSTKNVRNYCFFHVFWGTLYKVRIICEKTAFFVRAFCTTSLNKCEETVFFPVFRDTVQSSQKFDKKKYFELFPTFRKKCEKTVFFSHAFWDTFYKVCKKYEKTRFIEIFATISVRKQWFFHVFRDTLYKVRKKYEKHRFLSFLHDVPQKVWYNSFFFTFFETLCTKSQKIRKTVFFLTFCTLSHKKCEKTVFSHVFRDILYKACIICEITAFFELFARRPSINVRKQCFFPFFETLCTKFAKNPKKIFFDLFARRPTKSVRKVFFSRFSRHFVQSSHKMRKNSVFLSFLHNVPQ